MTLRMRLRLAALSQSLFVILRASGLLLVALGIISISLTVHYTPEQLLTMMESKPLWATRLHIWFPAPAPFRTVGIVAAALGLVMILLSVVWRRISRAE